MASKTTLIFVGLLFILCVTLVKETSSGCNVSEYYSYCFYGDKADFSGGSHRKVLGGVKELKRESNGWELRKVPSGPDPLHHHGKSPKKPRSP